MLSGRKTGISEPARSGSAGTATGRLGPTAQAAALVNLKTHACLPCDHLPRARGHGCHTGAHEAQSIRTG